MIELDDEVDVRNWPRPLLLVVLPPTGLVVGELDATQEAAAALEGRVDVRTVQAQASPRLAQLTGWRRGVRLALVHKGKVSATFEPVTVHRRGLLSFAGHPEA